MSGGSTSRNLLNLFNQASKELKSDEIIVPDDFLEASPAQNENYSKEEILDHLNNYKESFAFKLLDSKYSGYSKPTPKSFFIQSNLDSIFSKKSFYQEENGKIVYRKIPEPKSLTLKQIRNIIIKLLIFQYDVFNGFSPHESFLTCIYLFNEIYPDENSKLPPQQLLKIKLFKTIMQLFLVSFLNIEYISKEVYCPSQVFTKEWSPFNIVEEIEGFKHELVISKGTIVDIVKKENQNMTSLSKTSQKRSSSKESKNQKSSENKAFDSFKSLFENIKRKLKIIEETGSAILKTKYALEILNLSKFESQLIDIFITDRNENHLELSLLPDTVDDMAVNTPGFCEIIQNSLFQNEEDLKFTIKLNSDIKSYDDVKSKYSSLLNDINYIDSYAKESPPVTKVDDLTNLFLDWNSTHPDSITAVRFYFFRKYFPVYCNINWQLNQFRLNGPNSRTTTFEDFISAIIEKVKKLPLDHKGKMVKLLGKFFSYALRLFIFRPYKLQKSLLKTAVVQWVRNIWQIYNFDNRTVDDSKKIFANKDMKNIFYSVLHSYFKYYICYLFFSNLTTNGDCKDMIFLYSFLFINLILLPFASADNAKKEFLNEEEMQVKNQSGHRVREIRIYNCCFYILCYKFLKNHENPEFLISSLIDDFHEKFFRILKSIVKIYKTYNEDLVKIKNIDDFKIEEIYNQYVIFMNNKMTDYFRNKNKNLAETVKKKLAILKKIIDDDKNQAKGGRQQKCLENFLKINDNIDMFIEDPSKFNFYIQSAAYPYLDFEIVDQK